MTHGISKFRSGIAAASLLTLVGAGPALSLGLEFYEAGNPASLLTLMDNDLTDQNTNSGVFQFSSTCAGCPGPLMVGGFQLSQVIANSGIGGAAQLSFSFSGSSPAQGNADLFARVTDTGFYASRGLPPGSPFVTLATLNGNAATPDTGNKIADMSWRSWVATSNAPFDTSQIVGNVVATSADFTDIGNVNAAFASADNPVAVIQGQPFSLTQTVRIGTENDVDFSAFASTQVVPLPAALPALGAALGALGLLGWRRRTAA
ncbi:hypothetical protein [Meridianimarinicoccus sp. MJW13]|uniref:hypothetical protein n=1 Tax=Meridianimarinicoccus sp. MJW13 TaxID=2720031 RepID=UPI001866B841|nr:hypothetical protein [Fluviibacterium sp. MJW13]